jgi:hypothetical protein
MVLLGEVEGTSYSFVSYVSSNEIGILASLLKDFISLMAD